MTTETRTVWQLARMAECLDPDSTESPGARFLDRIESDYNERVEDGSYDEDTAHEIADGAVPIYTHEMWLTFVDLGAYQEDPSDLGYEEGDMDKAGAVCLYMIAHRLVHALHEAREDGE